MNSQDSSIFQRSNNRKQCPLSNENAIAFLQNILVSEFWDVQHVVDWFVPKDRLLYNTGSVCARCALVDRRRVQLSPAKVVQRQTKVYLIIEEY